MHHAGIIAEYDPFHSGHAWQLAAARALGADTVSVALSSGAVQRGSLPLLPEVVRVRAALQAGADLVFALPAPYACAGAEAFARAGVSLLAAAGCDALVFGAETPDKEVLLCAAAVLNAEAYRAELKAQLCGGARSFAAARAAAAEAVCPGRGLGVLLARPNDNLAVEYCRAVLAQGTGMEVFPLARQGANHGQPLEEERAADACAAQLCGPAATAGLPRAGGPAQKGSSALEPCAAPRYASASALRALWAQHGPAVLSPYVSAAALPLYAAAFAAGQDTDPRAFDIALLSRLRAKTPAELSTVRGISEGLEHLLAKQLRSAVTAGQLYDGMTGVRYPRARMRRLCLDAALGYNAAAFPLLPPYLQVLGAHRAALPLLAEARLPAGTSLAALARTGAEAAAVAAAQNSAADFGALCRRTPGPMGLAYTEKPIIL